MDDAIAIATLVQSIILQPHSTTIWLLPKPAMTAKIAQGLTPKQLAFFNDNGYLLIPDALSQDTVKQLLEDTNQMLNEFPLDEHPMTKFSTGGDDGADHVGDSYFLESGDKVRFFFEEGRLSMENLIERLYAETRPDAFDQSGSLTKPKHRAINKIGHYLHELSPSFRSISLSAQNAAIASSLGFRDPRVLQSMVICKQPEIGGAVPPHQDSTFLYTDPPSAVGWWYALEDATKDNGCLSFAAGSHKRTAIEKRFVRTGSGTGFIDNEGAKFPKGMTPGTNGEKDYEMVEKEEKYDMGEVKAGTLVLIHGNILHKSEKNTSEKSRNIYTFHVIEGEERYDERNWLQPPEKGFSKLYQEKAGPTGANGTASTNRLAKDW
ncbi:phytanoyl- dioxygenase [Pyrenophora seminiperda CCB06]|uniref:Phytanoyl-dioxygenase n=1 Tax=Pyrenophora seminiperda CCB06 TaxID=1302712 RepID=A0A3M7LW68_9PLEO|nr:phytanoyl- dioxygenase [Pyrenophora seminiperda CCB06]